MSVSLADITEDMIAEDQVRFPRVFSLSRRDKVVRTLVLGGGMLILLYGLNRFGFFGEKFWGSLGKMVVMFGQMFPPTGWEHINEYTYAIGETLSMAIIGSLIGGILALPFACMASKNLMPIRPIQFSFRRFADVLRAADYLIWGLVFVLLVRGQLHRLGATH